MICNHISLFRNNNPDKGTETDDEKEETEEQSEFRNNNPDKGTETVSKLNEQSVSVHV